MPFTPHAIFPLPASLPRSYYLGHHATALREIKQLISRIDLVLEVRDYRLPLTSHNPLLNEALRHDGVRRKRIVVFTKRDVGSPLGKSFTGPLKAGGRSLAKALGDQTASTDGLIRATVSNQSRNNGSSPLYEDDDGKHTVSEIKDETTFFLHPTRPASASAQQIWNKRHSPTALLRLVAQHASNSFSLTGTRVLVAGVPNVGKSTLLNALRSANLAGSGRPKVKKAAKVGGEAGVTRRLGTPVRILDGKDVDALLGLRSSGSRSGPGANNSEGKEEGVHSAQNGPVLLLDSPGVFVPFVPDGESMLKLALCGCVKEGLIPYEVLADYLIYRMNLIPPAYTAAPETQQTSNHPKASEDIHQRCCTGHCGYLTLVDGWARKKLGDARWEAVLSGSAEYTEDRDSPGPTNNAWSFLRWLASATGKLEAGGHPSYERAAAYFVQKWRAGDCGRFVLDEIDRETFQLRSSIGLQGRMDEQDQSGGENGTHVSASQARKAHVAMRKQEMRRRAKAS